MSEDEANIAGLHMDAANDDIKKRAFELLQEIRDLCVATSENNKPDVRIIDLMDIRGDRIYFLTARGKHFCELPRACWAWLPASSSLY
ncbi:hypothetical protein [Methanofollis fontis]|uniref:Uncharacterized protein n=1 Tax=Methanofollis fontis TaxID=2052832 RepID=A0A483CXN8_9EURY|nr:hypothetical protein [Methanofollis fontis]TAJ44709.1 hypothetical protein CUJ86_05255 [Methanofollis fontis]